MAEVRLADKGYHSTETVGRILQRLQIRTCYISEPKRTSADATWKRAQHQRGEIAT